MVVVTRAEELKDALASMPRVRIVGSGSSLAFASESDAPRLSIGLTGIVSISPDDQTVTVLAGTQVQELQAALEPHGLCIPYSHPWLNGTVGGQISLNLPHSLEYACGTWRDWVLAMRVVLGDRTECKTGSSVVKNVAGYDVQKLFIGAEGCLGAITEVTLKAFPLRALPPLDFEGPSEMPSSSWVHRVLPSDFALARENPEVFACHPATSTLYCHQVGPRMPHDWVRPWGLPTETIQKSSEQTLYEARAKKLFDPEGKFA